MTHTRPSPSSNHVTSSTAMFHHPFIWLPILCMQYNIYKEIYLYILDSFSFSFSVLYQKSVGRRKALSVRHVFSISKDFESGCPKAFKIISQHKQGLPPPPTQKKTDSLCMLGGWSLLCDLGYCQAGQCDKRVNGTKQSKDGGGGGGGGEC